MRTGRHVFLPALLILIILAIFPYHVFAQFKHDLIFVQMPDSGAADVHKVRFTDRFLPGSRIVLLRANTSQVIILTPELYAACDPDISFDAGYIIFAAKKTAADFWQIWRMATDGSGKTQITFVNGNCLNPVFAGDRFYLDDPEPTPQIIFSSDAHGWKHATDGESIFSLYATNPSGSDIRRISFNLNDDIEPGVLPIGRILFTSRQNFWYNGRPVQQSALMAINNDGTDLMSFYDDHQLSPEAKQVYLPGTDDRIYVIGASEDEPLGGGDLASFSLNRPQHSYRILISAQKGFYHSPCALPDGGLIASFRTRQEGDPYAICFVDTESGQRGHIIFREQGWHSIDIHIIRERQKIKGRANWLIPGANTGILYCLDSYRTDLENLADLRRGDIKYIRVIEGMPSYHSGTNKTAMGLKTFPSDPAGFYARRILGIAPVEEDGSFQIKIPAETPLNFQLLNKDYMTVRRQEAWIWVMGNENRGCIGCHEDRELSPPNILVNAVTKAPVDLVRSEIQRYAVDFVHEIGPLMQEKCSNGSCHSTGTKGFNFNDILSTEGRNDQHAVYQELVNQTKDKYITPGSALNSPLMRHFRRSGTVADSLSSDVANMRRLPHISLSETEWILFIEWIELGALWKSDAGSGGEKYND